MLTYRITRAILGHKPPEFRLRPAQLHAFGPIQPTCTFQPMRFQEYSTDENGFENESENTSKNASKKAPENKPENSSGKTSEMQDFSNQVTKLETSLENSLQSINEAIRDTRAWMRWFMGTAVTGIVLKIFLYDRQVEEKFMKGQNEMGGKFTKRQDV
ncbi:hypothetical protein HOY82DRAFT_673812, partial [Tuber indicum]